MLKKGEHYYMKGYHTDMNEAYDHMTVGVEIEAVEPAEGEVSQFVQGHHHSVKEIQALTIQAEQIFEKTRITVTDLDDGVFILIF